ncbi:hypothetical protein D3C86_1097760 [compost metagenome]
MGVNATDDDLVAAPALHALSKVGTLEGAVAPFGQHHVVRRRGELIHDLLQFGVDDGEARSPHIIEERTVARRLVMRLGGIDNRYAVLNRPSLHLCEIVDEGGHQLAFGLIKPQEITLHVVDEEYGAFRIGLPFCLVGRKACGDRHRIVGNAGDCHDDLGGLLRQGRLISGFGTLFLSVPPLFVPRVRR